ncbi:MAG: hypothetical protein ACNI3A_18380 [Desulfovibrio sp.]
MVSVLGQVSQDGYNKQHDYNPHQKDGCGVSSMLATSFAKEKDKINEQAE